MPWCFDMKVYKLEQHGRLLMTRAFVEGINGKAYPKLLIDTGSAYTILSQEMLEFLGASLATTTKRQRIITCSGYEIVPVVAVAVDMIILFSKNKKKIAEATTKKCPSCAEVIQREAKVCRFCNTKLETEFGH